MISFESAYFQDCSVGGRVLMLERVSLRYIKLGKNTSIFAAFVLMIIQGFHKRPRCFL